jgi:hypothetical protein
MGNAPSNSPCVVKEDTGSTAPGTGFLSRLQHRSKDTMEKKGKDQWWDTQGTRNKLDSLTWPLFSNSDVSWELKKPGYEKAAM